MEKIATENPGVTDQVKGFVMKYPWYVLFALIIVIVLLIIVLWMWMKGKKEGANIHFASLASDSEHDPYRQDEDIIKEVIKDKKLQKEQQKAGFRSRLTTPMQMYQAEALNMSGGKFDEKTLFNKIHSGN
jgi:hypothetical protein